MGDAIKMLEVVKGYFKSTGKGINTSKAAECMGISSKRKLHQLIDELERTGYVRTHKLQEKGNPRVIQPISLGGVD